MTNELKRSIGLTSLIFYGVGTMIGGGIYALLGTIVGEAGTFAPWSMLIAGVMAMFSALTFAELSARFPSSSGPAKYVTEAFKKPILGGVFGWLVIATGVVSAATLTVAISGFFLDLIGLPLIPGQLIVALVIFAFAAWGIKESVVAVAIITLAEVIGLLLVIGVNFDSVVSPDLSRLDLLPSCDWPVWSGIIAGSFIAFYAFIGFEDLVTLAEEVKSSESTLPKAIIASLVITILLYVTIAIVAVLTVDSDAFAESNTPMAYLVRDSRWLSPEVLMVISLLAGFNGGLVQAIMSSRVLYGMAQNGQAPKLFSRINSRTQTPVEATLLTTAIVFLLAFSLDLTTLAKVTSGIILFVFASMNLSLLKIKRDHQNHLGFQVPSFVPLLGLLLSVGSLVFVLAGTVSVAH